jgi:hypothetical protein
MIQRQEVGLQRGEGDVTCFFVFCVSTIEIELKCVIIKTADTVEKYKNTIQTCIRKGLPRHEDGPEGIVCPGWSKPLKHILSKHGL